MQLKDQNKLQVEDTVAKYIPNFPQGNSIQLKHLLTHTSGIPEYEQGKEDISHEELIKRIGNQKRIGIQERSGSILIRTTLYLHTLPRR